MSDKIQNKKAEEALVETIAANWQISRKAAYAYLHMCDKFKTK